MNRLGRVVHRVVPALMVAGGVTVLASGLLALTSDATVRFSPGPSAVAALSSGPDDGSGSESPSGLLVWPSATLGSSPSSAASMPQPSASPSPSVRPSATPRRAIRATRVVVPSLRIDLPVVSSDLEVPGNRDAYPLCDVAQYLSGYDQPNREGITYIYGHARAKMFLPLLLASQRQNGAEMIGALVQVYTNEPRAYLFEITRVRRHATTLPRQDALKPGERVLYLQTSEGPHGTVPKLQVVARLLASEPARAPVAMPTPKPRACPP